MAGSTSSSPSRLSYVVTAEQVQAETGARCGRAAASFGSWRSGQTGRSSSPSAADVVRLIRDGVARRNSGARSLRGDRACRRRPARDCAGSEVRRERFHVRALCRRRAAKRPRVHAGAFPVHQRHVRRARGAARSHAGVGHRSERRAADRARREAVRGARQRVRRAHRRQLRHYNGKVLRFNMDATTPDDQPGPIRFTRSNIRSRWPSTGSPRAARCG